MGGKSNGVIVLPEINSCSFGVLIDLDSRERLVTPNAPRWVVTKMSSAVTIDKDGPFVVDG